MTRFARAKGSKASNERVPESATPWGVMKNDLKKTQNEINQKESREKMNKERQEKYDEFLDAEDEKKGKKWAEFPKATPNKQAKKGKKRNVTEEDVTDEMIDSFIKSDEELDSELQDKIEKALKQADEGPEEKSSKKGKKKQKNEEHTPKRRKPDLEDHMSITINGEKQKIKRMEGFPVLETDFDRLQTLRQSLVKKGIPKSEVKRTMQTERRKAEKYLSRLKKQVCFNCRKSGHVLSECPDLGNSGNVGLVDQSGGVGICFKCGSTEHKLSECKSQSKGGDKLKYASCFICREQGHLARECPDNPRGLYPQGGACRACGDVTHLKKDCPTNLIKVNDGMNVSLGTITGGDVEALDANEVASKKEIKIKRKSIVKF